VYQGAASVPTLNGSTAEYKIWNALKFDGMDMRQATIKMAHGDTCQWFFDSTEYKRWRDDGALEDHHGFMWIRGKPGAGKSTLMKLAVKDADRRFPDLSFSAPKAVRSRGRSKGCIVRSFVSFSLNIPRWWKFSIKMHGLNQLGRSNSLKSIFAIVCCD
jgi:hypothetical protein